MARHAVRKTQTGEAWLTPSQMLTGMKIKRARRRFLPDSIRGLLG
jgi:hypothetical protein